MYRAEPAEIRKEAVSGTPTNTFRWKTTYTAKQALTDVTITDTVDQDASGNVRGVFQTIVPNSVHVYTDYNLTQELSTDKYTLIIPDGARTLTLLMPSMAANDCLYIVYDTIIPTTAQNVETTLYNTVSDGTRTSTASQNRSVDNLYKEGGWTSSNGVLTWRIRIHDVGADAQTVTVTDTLPTGFTYVPQSLEAIDNPWNGRNTVDGVQVRDNGDGMILFTIVAGTAAMQEARTSDGLYLEYNTKASAAVETSGVHNSAVIAVDGVAQTPDEGWANYTKPTVLSKTGSFTDPNVDYTIKVNEGGFTLNDGHMLELTDVLGDALALRMGSISIRRGDNTELSEATYAYDADSHKLVFHIPDGTPAIITYRAVVQVGATDHIADGAATNTATLEGVGQSVDEKSYAITDDMRSTHGSMEVTANQLQIYKYMDGDIGESLAGVTFTAVPLTGVADGGTWTVTGTDSAYGTLTAATSTTGQISDMNLEADVVYRVTETVPAGFVGVDPLYLVFPKSGNAGAWSGIEKVKDDTKEYELTVAAVGDATQTFYPWNVNNDHTMRAKLRIRKQDTKGNALSGATLQLFTLTGKEASGSWESNSEVHEIDNLKAGTYLLRETKAPDGYQRADDVQITIKADGTIFVDGQKVTVTIEDDTPIATVTMTDEPETTSLVARKTWNDGNNQDGKRRSAVFYVYRQVGNSSLERMDSTRQSISPTSNTLELTWADLPVREGNQTVSYQVLEEVMEGYTTTISEETVGEGNNAKKVRVFTNTYTPECTSITVTKEWKGLAEGETHPDSVQVQLMGNGKAKGTPVTLNGDNSWSHTFANLEKYADGTAIAYTVTEMSGDALTGYITSVTRDVADSSHLIVRNTKRADPKKVVISKRDITGATLAGATLQLSGTRDDGVPFETTTWLDSQNDKSLELSPGTYTLTELNAPVGYRVADPITFTVTEDTEQNALIVHIDGQAVPSGIVVMTDQYQPSTLRVTKTSAGTGAALAGAVLEVTGTPTGGTPIEPITWTSGTTPHPLTLAPGTYRLREVSAPAGYQLAEGIEFRLRPDGSVLVGDTVLSEALLTMADEPNTTNVFFSKTELGADIELPGAEFTLTGTTSEGVAITPISWTSNGTMQRIPLADGTYTLTETKAPDGYEAAKPTVFTITDHALVVNEKPQTDTVVRVQDERVPMVAVSATKQWQDDNNRDKLRPESVQVRLLADNEEVGDWVTLSAANNWTSTWTDLRKYRQSDGKEITYTIRENLDGQLGQDYHVSVRRRPVAYGISFGVVNIHQPDSTQIALEKVWDDADDQDGKRPTGISVAVYGTVTLEDGTTRTTQLIDLGPDDLVPDADGNWRWELLGLPTKDPSGRTYTFKVEERNITDGYTLDQKASNCSGDGLVLCDTALPDGVDDMAVGDPVYRLVNHHEPETVTLGVRKVWDDGGNVSKVRPKEITVWLLSKEVDEQGIDVINNEFNGWPAPQYTFVNASVTTMQPGTPLTQSSEDGYVLPIEEDGTCVRGAYNYGVSCLILTAPNTGTSTTTTVDTNTWTAQFENLPRYRNGHRLRYTLTEQAVDSYEPIDMLTGLIPDTEREPSPVASTDSPESADTVQTLTARLPGTHGTFTIGNSLGVTLPVTGGSGTRAMQALGLMVIALAAVLALALAAIHQASHRQEGAQ
ncbi:MAG: Cna B-type domain-containing protein [Bifidobacterium sp.]|nr:Cna B-type domain-containing protein [Bifidobacterium sp.]